MKIGDLVYYESKFRIRQGVGIITGKGVSSFHWRVFQSDGETRHYTELELRVIA